MFSSRRFVIGAGSFSIILTIAAIVLTVELTPAAESTETCAIAPIGNSANEWLCTLIWAVSGVTLAALIVLTFVMCGMLWYRGGCYKFLQFLALLVPAVAWALVGVNVTIQGLEANKQPESEYQSAIRIALMAVTLANAAMLGVCALLRLFVKPGKIKQKELDRMEVEKLAQHRSPAPAVWFRRRYGGYLEDESYGKLDDEDVYIPRHPWWYGRWLLPSCVDLSSWPCMPPVLDQGQLGTCTANAACNAYCFALVKEARTKPYPPSRLFVYFNIYHKLLKERVDYDRGATLRSACLSVQKYGACHEEFFPYTDNKQELRYPPSQAAIKDGAARKKLLKPIKLFPGNLVHPQQKEYTLMAALARGHPIACGICYYDHALKELDADYPVLLYPGGWEMQQILRGGKDSHHAVLLVGYDRNEGWFKFQNSWGRSFGQQGYFYTGIEYLMDHRLARDFWMFND